MSAEAEATAEADAIWLSSYLQQQCGYEPDPTDPTLLAYEYVAEAIGWSGGIDRLDQDDDVERPRIERIAASQRYREWDGRPRR